MLEALREGLRILQNDFRKSDSFLRLRSDVSDLARNCSEFWTNLGDVAEIGDPTDELSQLGTASRYHQIRSTWESEREMGRNRTNHISDSQQLALSDNAPHAGTAFAASIGTAVVALIPTIMSGSQSVFTTLVHAGSHAVLPQYILRDGQMVIDHYTILTSPDTIQGWAPQVISSISATSIPVFASMFALAYGLDGLHGYMNNQCSARAALVSLSRGALAGTVLGVSYYALVSSFGLVYAPVISTGLCMSWLIRLYANKSLSSSDLAIGTVGNISGITAFLLSGNPLVSMLVSILGGLVGGRLHELVSNHWSNQLHNRLVAKCREVLNIDSCDPSRSQIDSAFRNEARKHHPDKQGGTREIFELMSVARDILLMDLQKRQDDEKAKANDTVLSRLIIGFKHAVDTFVVGPDPMAQNQRSLPSSQPKTLSNQFLYSPD